MDNSQIEQLAKDYGERAQRASQKLRSVSTESKNAVLATVVQKLRSPDIRERILNANGEDVSQAQTNGLDAALVDRLVNRKSVV